MQKNNFWLIKKDLQPKVTKNRGFWLQIFKWVRASSICLLFFSRKIQRFMYNAQFFNQIRDLIARDKL